MKNQNNYRFKVVITDHDYGSFEPEKEELNKIGAEVVTGQCKTEDEVIEIAKDADGLLVEYANITRRVIESLKKCKVIARYGIGVDNIDIEAATEYGIIIINVPKYCIDEVSDHTVALMLSCVRKIVLFNNAVKKGIWDFKIAKPIFRLKNMKLGLVGYGSIARMFSEKAKTFGLKVIAYDPYVDSSTMAQADVEKVDLDFLLGVADIISLHLPLTKETKHLISEREIKLMKKNACIINTSRGPLINEKDLYRALKEKWISGAAIDVTETEPIDQNNDLLKLDNIIITPHVSFYSEESLIDLQRNTARGVAQILMGEMTPSILNKSVIEKENYRNKEKNDKA
ncbi:MAG: C-terminal binding protein [Atribacterota bacterium]|jgi:D-3-phosphoglycerate dehydrogenase|nr:C-terminal binding protein [Atribacterota bacterium]